MRALPLVVLFAVSACGPHTGSADAGTAAACHTTTPADAKKCALVTANTLPEGRTSAVAVTLGSSVVVVGGQGPGGSLATGTFVSSVSSSGAAGAWSPGPSLPDSRQNAGIAASGSTVFLFGGERANPSSIANEVLVAHRTAGGELGAWTPTKPMPESRTQLAAAATTTHAYLVGGKKDLPTPQDTAVTVATLDAEGNVTAYAPGPPLPEARSRPSLTIANGFLYVVGGLYAGNDKSCAPHLVLFARIQDDGSLGAWTPTTSFSKLPAGSGLASDGTHLYVVGGTQSYGDLLNQKPVGSVLSAAISADGSVGTWSRVGTLADQRYGQGAALVNGALFSIGGLVEGTQVLGLVDAAHVNADGSLSCP